MKKKNQPLRGLVLVAMIAASLSAISGAAIAEEKEEDPGYLLARDTATAVRWVEALMEVDEAGLLRETGYPLAMMTKYGKVDWYKSAQTLSESLLREMKREEAQDRKNGKLIYEPSVRSVRTDTGSRGGEAVWVEMSCRWRDGDTYWMKVGIVDGLVTRAIEMKDPYDRTPAPAEPETDPPVAETPPLGIDTQAITARVLERIREGVRNSGVSPIRTQNRIREALDAHLAGFGKGGDE